MEELHRARSGDRSTASKSASGSLSFVVQQFPLFEIVHSGGRFVKTQEVNEIYKAQEIDNSQILGRS